ncbi:hypothetical protein CLV24_10186 [Pontibacter ummariensis]|uniref:Uncharacterized protein n=1 Tax=Pontibacter ummariensis TaxID=1610492 RepID=A0A239B1P0_9BACT|nr:hypothetical protein [Pontibacter ummariensis]PRY16242.1 hypothetical protein CLV24_10186 [Pontibacter ummariensis]SNS01709.1 hypothetical protein SAMN06296052_10186 [Pontibacter ummariensis]
MEQAKILTFNLSAGLFRGKRRLRLTPDYLEYENGGLEKGFTRVYKEDISDIKRSMNWIIWYRFFVGCDFKFDIRTKTQGILPIGFVSYFRKNKSYIDAYETIGTWMWEHYLGEVVKSCLQDLHSINYLVLGGVGLSREGAYLDSQGTLTTWDDVAVMEYEEYFAIYSQRNPELNRRIAFDAWESDLLMQVTRALQQAATN